MLEGKFKVEVIAQGQFKDCGLLIHTTVIRLNSDAMNEWIESSILNDRYCYECEEEWVAYKEKMEATEMKSKTKSRRPWESRTLKQALPLHKMFLKYLQSLI